MTDEAGLERAAKRLLTSAAVAAAGPAGTGAPQPRSALFSLTNSLRAAVMTCPPAPTALPQPEALLQHPPAAALPQPGSLLLQPPLLAPALGAPAGRSNPLPYRARFVPATAVFAKPSTVRHGLPPRTLPPARLALPPSPGWPACSLEQPRQASEDGSSPRAGLHVLAADVREAANSGAGKLTKVRGSLPLLLLLLLLVL